MMFDIWRIQNFCKSKSKSKSVTVSTQAPFTDSPLLQPGNVQPV